ncbi:MAG: hypothetical protein CL850_02205 [Crocinitomicaceae bacterium]|nr:hypothetical protein [Crocinitomicaceae bacterium]
MIVGAVMLFFGVNYLKGFNPLAKQDHLYAVYDKIEGLAVSNPVLVNGFKVGQVTSIEFHNSGDGKLLVEFTVEQSELDIPINSVAQIFSSDLFGSKAIELLKGDSTVFALNGDTLIASNQEDITEAVRKELAPLRAKTDQLIAGVDEIITNMNKVFKDDATLGLPSTFESINRTFNTLENTAIQLDSLIIENRTVLNSVMTNLDGLAENLNDNNDAISNIIKNFSLISDSLVVADIAETLKKADTALENITYITDKAKNGKGTLGKIIVNDSLYNGLVTSSVELQELLDDLQLNPWKYVRVSLFGRKQQAKMSKGDLKRMRKMIREEIEIEENKAK